MRVGTALVFPWLASPGRAARKRATIRKVRVSTQGTTTRVVFDLSGPVEHNIFSLHQPERVVIDLKRVHLAASLNALKLAPSLITRVRYAARDSKDLRIVFDLNANASPRSFLLPPAKRFGHRLVVDLHRQGKESAPVKSVDDRSTKRRDVVIAIDAGHGGKDPGAIGRGGTREKDVVLSIARKLAALIKKDKGMRAVMIRSTDVFLPLRTRIDKARKLQADLFISIHADAAPNKRMRGSSVYVLSRRGATSEHARRLAKRENEADLIGGVSLNGKDDVLASVLLDLSQTATIEASMNLAGDILKQLERVGRVRSQRIEQAGFAVLKSPDIPSVLVETAFISNPAEEKRLRSKAHQQALAKGMQRGIREYFRKHAPAGTELASTGRDRHVIRNGETLSTIANRYSIGVSDLRRYNSLNNDRIRVGQVLQIPVSDG